MDFKDKNILIYGLKSSGIAAAEIVKVLGGNLFVYDDNIDKIKEMRDLVPDSQFFSTLNVENLKHIDCMVISPAVSIYNKFVRLAQKLKIPVISELELGYLMCKAPIAAITGTNGKTTVTGMTTAILNASGIKAYALGNIGTPLCEKALTLSKSDIAVCEVSSFQLEAVKEFKPHIAALLNVTPDHINRHKTFKNYFDCKTRIFKNMTINDYAVLNFDSSECMSLVTTLKCKIVYFSVKNKVKGAYLSGSKIYFSDGYADKYICSVEDIKLKGEHNVQNALAAICIAYTIGANVVAIKTALSTFAEQKDRIEFVKNIDGIDYYNDSKSTNVSAAQACFKMFNKPLLVILGGSDKGFSFNELFKNLPQNIKFIAVMGANAPKILKCAQKYKYTNVERVYSLAEAVKLCRENAVSGDAILLCPASASFDMFKDYEQRGAQFKQIVLELLSKENNE